MVDYRLLYEVEGRILLHDVQLLGLQALGCNEMSDHQVVALKVD